MLDMILHSLLYFYMSPFVNTAFQDRLAALGCSRLPQFVLRSLRAQIDVAATKSITRIVEREVSSTKIARIFARGIEPSARSHGGFEGEAGGVPFDQSALLILAPEQDETKAVTGTAARPNTSQP